MILQDEHLASYIAKNNVFKPIIDVFTSNGSRYNLLNSAVLELFEHIRKVFIHYIDYSYGLWFVARDLMT